MTEENNQIEKKDIVIDFSRFGINPKKYPLLLLCLIVILASLIYIAIYGKTITTVTYRDGCNETYINGEIQTAECPLHYYEQRQMFMGNSSFNEWRKNNSLKW